MDSFISDFKHRFAESNMVAKLIYINVGIFLLLRLVSICFQLFNHSCLPLLHNLQMPAMPMVLWQRPWTVLTYMFVHIELWHLLFNVFCLYWFGRYFLSYFTGRQLTGLYLLGGLAGALFFLLSYNLFPYFQDIVDFSYLTGSSASVMAIAFGIAFSRKDLGIDLFLLGHIRLIYIVIFIFIMNLTDFHLGNAGGHIAHIGGALAGVLFATEMQRGKDPTTPINRFIDWCVNLLKHQPRVKQTTSRRVETDQEYNARKHQEETSLDAILEKLKHSGYTSLSADEKKQLFDASRK